MSIKPIDRILDLSRKYFSVDSILASDPATASLPEEVLQDMLSRPSVKEHVSEFDLSLTQKDYFVRKPSANNFWEAVNEYLGRSAPINLSRITLFEAWRKLGYGLQRQSRVKPADEVHYAVSRPDPEQFEQLDFFPYSLDLMEQRFRKEREQAAEREREMLVQSDLGKEIRELVTTLPPGRNRPETARMLDEKMAEYIAGISAEHTAEAAEILRRGTEFVQSRVNVYIRKYVVPRLRELEMALEQQSHMPYDAN